MLELWAEICTKALLGFLRSYKTRDPSSLPPVARWLTFGFRWMHTSDERFWFAKVPMQSLDLKSICLSAPLRVPQITSLGVIISMHFNDESDTRLESISFGWSMLKLEIVPLLPQVITEFIWGLNSISFNLNPECKSFAIEWGSKYLRSFGSVTSSCRETVPFFIALKATLPINRTLHTLDPVCWLQTSSIGIWSYGPRLSIGLNCQTVIPVLDPLIMWSPQKFDTVISDDLVDSCHDRWLISWSIYSTIVLLADGKIQQFQFN